MPTQILFQQVASRYFAHSTVQFRSHYWGTLKKNILPSYLRLRLETDCCFRHHRPNASALHWSRAHFDVIWQCRESEKINKAKIKVENVYTTAFSTSNLQPTERPRLRLHRSVFVFNLCSWRVFTSAARCANMLLPTERDAGQLSFFHSLLLRERFAIVPWQPQLLILPGWNKPLFKDLKLLASNSKDDKQQPHNESPCNKVVFHLKITNAWRK